jgi:hypothetical protein
LGPVLQLDSLKLESCKFNIIINIINITLGSSVTATPKAIGYIFVERPNTFRLTRQIGLTRQPVAYAFVFFFFFF